MTTTTPRAGYPAPTNTGTSFPQLSPHQRKYMRISNIAGVQSLTWYYKVVIFTQNGMKMTACDAISNIGMALLDEHEDINLVNINTNTTVTEDEVIDLLYKQQPQLYYSDLHINTLTSTTTITIQLRTHLTDKYHDFRDPLGHIQVRLDKSLRFHFDEFLGIPTKLVGAILNTPHNQIHRDCLSQAITTNLPISATMHKPIIKASITNLSYTLAGKRATTKVVGIFAPIGIAAEVSGTIKKVLQDDELNLACGLGHGHFFSSKELARGPARDSAIAIHLQKIEQQFTVNLYRLELHDLDENISPEICNQLLYTTHKKSEIIISKLNLLQAYFNKEHHATSARLSYFTDKRDQPTLHIHTTKQQVHLIYEALHSLDSSLSFF